MGKPAEVEHTNGTAAVAEAAPSEKLPVKFDLENYTGRDAAAFMDASKNNDLFGMCQFLATVVVECPVEWGNPSDPETYMNLPMKKVLKRLINQFGEAAAADEGN